MGAGRAPGNRVKAVGGPSRCWGTGKFSTTSGQGEMMLTTTLLELEAKAPAEGVTGNFTGRRCGRR